MDLLHYLQIVFLGIVEGVTEFLPISSTGHLLIAEHLMGTKEPDIFNVVIQAGAILAVVFIYWHKIAGLFGNLDRRESRNDLIKIALAFAVTTVLYLVVSKLIGHHKLTESLGNVAWATLIGGLVIFGIEYVAKNLYPHEDVSWFEAILIGVAQVIAAIFPGASRSGSTIMAGLAVGMKRTSVTEFSFLVGIPTMFAASAFAVIKGREELHGITKEVMIDTAIGFVVSTIVAFFVVKWLLRFIQSHTFNGFAIYRILLGGGLLICLYMKVIPDISNDKPESATPAPAVAPATATIIAPAPPPYDQPVNTPPRPMPVDPDQFAKGDPAKLVPASSPLYDPPAPGPDQPTGPINPASAPGANSRPINPNDRATLLTPENINQPVFNVHDVSINASTQPAPTGNVPAPPN